MKNYFMEYIFKTKGLLTKIAYIILFWDEILYYVLNGNTEENL